MVIGRRSNWSNNGFTNSTLAEVIWIHLPANSLRALEHRPGDGEDPKQMPGREVASEPGISGEIGSLMTH